MNYTKPALLATIGTPILLGLSLPRETVNFGPAAGLSLKKTFESTTEMTLDEMDMLMNGEPMPFPMEMDISISIEQSIAVVDTYGETVDGRPARLERTYDTLSNNAISSISSSMMGDDESEAAGESELEGLTVIFSWDADEGDYSVAFAEGSDGDEELLDGLAEDMDLRALLPEGDVAEGDTWSIDADSIVDLLAPGGDLAIIPEDTDLGGMGMPGGGGMDIRQMLGDVDGDVSAELTGIREGETGRIAVIALSLEIESTNDLTEFVQEMMEDAEMPPEAGNMEIESVDVEMSVEGEGELLWNVTTGHFVELNLSTEMESTMDQAMSLSMGPESMTIEQSMIFASSGSLTYSAEQN